MERLSQVIEEHGRWSNLTIYVDRIKVHKDDDFSLALENAKALLEAIGKEICKENCIELGKSPTVNTVMKKAYASIGSAADSHATQISTSLANIGQHMGSLRNEISITSHGKTQEEIRERNNTVDSFTQELLLDTTAIIAKFMIQRFEIGSGTEMLTPVLPDISYEECETFNEVWDELHGEFNMGEYSYLASQILYNVDYQAFLSEYWVDIEEPQ